MPTAPLLEVLLVQGRGGRQAAPASCRGCHRPSLFPIAIDGAVHVLRGGQEGLELGPGAEARHVGREQGEGVQAVGGQDLVNQQQVQQVVVGEGDLQGRGGDQQVGADQRVRGRGGPGPEPVPSLSSKERLTCSLHLFPSVSGGGMGGAGQGPSLTWLPTMKAWPPWFWESRVSKGFRRPGSSFT